MSLSDYTKNSTPVPAPKGWEPHVEITGNSGTAVLRMPSATAREEELLTESGFDTSEYRIKGDIGYRKWMRYDQEWLHYYKFDVERITEETPEERAADLNELIKKFAARPLKKQKVLSGDDVFLINLSDWQMGKNSEHTAEGVRHAFTSARERLVELRRQGRALPTIALVGGGDLVEGCDGHYAMQTFTVDLDRRGQVKVVRRLIAEAIRYFAPVCYRLIVSGVGGNHGQNRKDGKAYTSFADNDDVAVLEMLQEVFEDRPGFEHVEFFIPDDELSICLDLGGVNVGFTHGHLASRGGSLPQAKQQEWWKGQFWSDTPVKDAQILITSHYHHLTISNYGQRTHIQNPAFDGGSKWWGDATGLNSPDGMLTLVIDRSHPLGWDDLKVL